MSIIVDIIRGLLPAIVKVFRTRKSRKIAQTVPKVEEKRLKRLRAKYQKRIKKD